VLQILLWPSSAFHSKIQWFLSFMFWTDLPQPLLYWLKSRLIFNLTGQDKTQCYYWQSDVTCPTTLQNRYIKYEQVSFYARVTFLRNVARIKHKIPISNSVFPGWGGEVREFTTSPYVVYDYTSSGNMELWTVLYVQSTNTFLYSTHTFLYNILTSNAIKM